MRRSIFLSNVRQRLVDDVGPYFEAIDRKVQRTGTGFGFWALARMLFPVVEAVASVIYRTRKTSTERSPVRLLRTLGFEYPNLVWEMYRHTLMHNDEMANASYKGRRVAWSISVNGQHEATPGRLNIDAAQLYDDLLAFLDREASQTRREKTTVWVKESFRFNRAFGKATRAEILQLGSRK